MLPQQQTQPNNNGQQPQTVQQPPNNNGPQPQTQPVQELLDIAIYCYHKECLSGEFYFGFVRQCPSNYGRRVTSKKKFILPDVNKEGHYGKWSHIGGDTTYTEKMQKISGQKFINNTTDLINRAIKQFTDQTGNYKNKSLFTVDKIDLTPIGIEYKSNEIPNIKCNFLKIVENKKAVFAFEIFNEQLFFDVFPKNGKTSPTLFESSNGKIDAIVSLPMEHILNNQNWDAKKNNQNLFIKDSIFTFLYHVLNDYLFKIEIPFYLKWKGKQLDAVNDTTERDICELKHILYVTGERLE